MLPVVTVLKSAKHLSVDLLNLLENFEIVSER